VGAEAFMEGSVVEWLRASVPETPVMQRVRRECERRGLPNVSPESGPVLALLARLGGGGDGAARALEIGCLLGYSGLWILSGLRPDGRLETIEAEEEFAKAAEGTFREAGFADRVAVHRGLALDVLPRLPDAAYDLVFIDADKREYVDYLGHALRVLRPGGVAVADNVLWSGRVLDESVQDADTQGLRRYVEAATTAPNLDTVLLPVGDGLSVSVLRKPAWAAGASPTSP
jgi:predicted O-methyltransferase YrrM